MLYTEILYITINFIHLLKSLLLQMLDVHVLNQTHLLSLLRSNTKLNLDNQKWQKLHFNFKFKTSQSFNKNNDFERSVQSC